MSVIDAVSEGDGLHSTATGCSPGGAGGAAGDSGCHQWHSVPAASLVLGHAWHTAVRSSAHCLPFGRSELVQSGTPVSASLVTSRATLCLLVPHAIIGGTRDGVNEKVSRHSPAVSDQSPKWGPCTFACLAGETAALPAICQGQRWLCQPSGQQEASVLLTGTLTALRSGGLGSEGDKGLCLHKLLLRSPLMLASTKHWLYAGTGTRLKACLCGSNMGAGAAVMSPGTCRCLWGNREQWSSEMANTRGQFLLLLEKATPWYLFSIWQ